FSGQYGHRSNLQKQPIGTAFPPEGAVLLFLAAAGPTRFDGHNLDRICDSGPCGAPRAGSDETGFCYATEPHFWRVPARQRTRLAKVSSIPPLFLGNNQCRRVIRLSHMQCRGHAEKVLLRGEPCSWTA